MRGFKTASAAVLSLLVLGNAAATADYRERIYLTTYYSDATHQSAVGSLYAECGPNEAVYQLSGSSSQYETVEWVGWCTPSGPEYI